MSPSYGHTIKTRALQGLRPMLRSLAGRFSSAGQWLPSSPPPKRHSREQVHCLDVSTSNLPPAEADCVDFPPCRPEEGFGPERRDASNSHFSSISLPDTFLAVETVRSLLGMSVHHPGSSAVRRWSCDPHLRTSPWHGSGTTPTPTLVCSKPR